MRIVKRSYTYAEGQRVQAQFTQVLRSLRMKKRLGADKTLQEMVQQLWRLFAMG